VGKTNFIKTKWAFLVTGRGGADNIITKQYGTFNEM
jgi:hypothetical protein